MAGLLSFLGFGKKEKPNLVSPVARPQAAQLSNVPMLRDIAKTRLTSGQGLGFGDEYTSKASNPGIAKLESSFQNSTMPKISSEASKRGLARSSIVTDQISQAEQSKNRDVSDLISKFYTLNEAQKKQDYGQALTLAQNLDQQEAGLLSDAAAEGERVRDLTAGRADTNNANSLKRQNQTIGTLMNMVVPGSGMAFTSATTPAQTPTSSTKNTGSGSSGIKTQLLGSLDPQSVDAMSIEELLSLFGG